MVETTRWLALEVADLEGARSFYESVLDLDERRAGEEEDEDEKEDQDEVAFGVGDAVGLRLRAPGPVPRGGVHVHYALSVPRSEYDDWYARLDERFDLTEHQFGRSRSLYFFDPDGHCVELAESDVAGPGVDGLFEVVLEVEDLEQSVEFYRDLDFEIVDRGGDRRRVRLSNGDVDLELWEPQIGLADARGGVHVDWGVAADDPSRAARRVAGAALAVESIDEGIRLRDPDGHYLTLL